MLYAHAIMLFEHAVSDQRSTQQNTYAPTAYSLRSDNIPQCSRNIPLCSNIRPLCANSIPPTLRQHMVSTASHTKTHTTNSTSSHNHVILQHFQLDSITNNNPHGWTPRLPLRCRGLYHQISCHNTITAENTELVSGSL